jgi:superfamily II DNA or RNA helicase
MFCRHPRLSTLPKGLFDGLTSFRDLEARIAPLPEELQRGDALEVFVEAYLQTHPLFQVQDLWLVGQIPAEVRKALNLPRDHKGIDGVFRTRDGTLVPYQVKFRIARPQVTVREVSTFLGLTERATDRMLISNSDRYAGDIENRDRLRILKGTYFDSLSCDELAAIAEWLKGRPTRPTLATPHPHQQIAIQDTIAALSAEDRATVVMACGTGKTLVGLRVAEAIASQAVLVLVPSLALLSQALADWSRDTTWGDRFEYLCVCSDPSVSEAVDEWTLRTTETPFPVETKSKVVQDFLSRPPRGAVRVVFSTYQSAPIVAKGVPRGSEFDVAIFDEAHKTAGPHGGTFTFALDNRRLGIRKRLFLTATPRKADVRHKNRQGDFRVVSMDDSSVYGKRAHDLSFASAVAQGIICDYRVVVSTIDAQELSATAIRHGITLVKGNQHATRWVATQIAVAKAIQETGARKIITFHSRVEQAKHFASDSPKGIGHFLADFNVGHVSGADPVAVRKEVLAGFREDRKQLVANARCLTEGVDFPAVDMVVFSNPRKSKVDIIQAIGRAMRKPKGGDKTLGYVVIPILLESAKAGDLETACRKTDWEDVVDVLAALRDHDFRLDDLIRCQQVAVGECKVFNPSTFSEHVRVIGPAISVDALQRHISALILQRLGVAWDLRFGELRAFKAKEGHCNVPDLYPPNPLLGPWLGRQRSAKKRGLLAAERVAQLDALGVIWDVRAASWESQFQSLMAFHVREGHSNVPDKYREDPKLAQWCGLQRQFKRQQRLLAERQSRLETLGFIWDVNEHEWEARYLELERYKATHGHCDVPQRKPHAALGSWASVQRTRWRTGKLSPDRVKRLESLGFVWNLEAESWKANYEALVAFKRKEGHCNVPRSFLDEPALGRWLVHQRILRMKNKLAAERIQLLEAIGITWNPVEAQWEEKFERLVAFKEREGHANVPGQYSEDVELANWAGNQRAFKRRGQLTPERITRLEAIGFCWAPNDAYWDARLRELAAFAQSEGHCNVPVTFHNRPLALWVVGQRSAFKGGKLSQERIVKLESLGFVWDPFAVAWEQRCRELRAFRAKHGHSNVPQVCADYPGLGVWLNKQRQKRKKGGLETAREEMLDSLGVVWQPKKGPPSTAS